MEQLTRIASFNVDHNTLERGVYISRIDGDIITYDMRFVKPNTPPFLPSAVMHTIEHLFATYARNSAHANNVIYFGPMGCRTGFYFLLRNTDKAVALELIKELVQKCMLHSGAIPGQSAIECGNYLEMDFDGAITALQEYYNVIKDKKVTNLDY